MVESFITLILIIALIYVVLVQVEMIEEKKRGRREGRLDYYGNEIEEFTELKKYRSKGDL
jgi:hypothetical protein|tara:strand:+ start:671 stop:850 length:180 start_codon:yes stop_codon:yes gene_type:complete